MSEELLGRKNFERALITHILDSKNIRDVINQKITPEFFDETQTRSAFMHLMRWYNNPKYGDVPSWETFSVDFPEFDVERCEDGVQVLCDHLRREKLYKDLVELVRKIHEGADGDEFGMLKTLQEETVVLTVAHTVDETTTLANRINDLREEYLLMKSGATGLKGKPYPWPALNQATLGLQDGQLVFFYGRPKSGKTWELLRCAQALHDCEARVLVLSQELSDIEICRRYVALATGVDYAAYQRGALPPDVEFEFLQNLDIFAEKPPFVISQLSGTGEQCLTELSAKIDEYQATVVLLDGVYFLGEDWKELSKVTRGLKRIAKAKKIPIIGTTQANRSQKGKGKEQGGADDFAYGDSFYQDCDLAIRISVDIEDRQQHQAKLAVAAIREGQTVAFTVNRFLCTNMTQKAIIQSDEDGNDMDAQNMKDKLDGESDIPDETKPVKVNKVILPSKGKLKLKSKAKAA